MKHLVTIDTKPKNNRKVDPPRSCWSCTCGASNPKLTSPAEANAEADRHLTEVKATKEHRHA